jgi:hypothetical protein
MSKENRRTIVMALKYYGVKINIFVNTTVC